MAFQSVPNTAEAVIQQVLAAQTLVNVVNFQRSGGYDNTSLFALATAVDDWFGTEVLTGLSNQLGYTGTLCRGLEDENDITASVSTTAGQGGIVSNSLPANAALVVTHRSNFTGRSARGRTYHCGIPLTAQQSAATVTGAFTAFLNAAWDTLPTYLSGTGWVHVIVSRYAALMKRETGVTFVVDVSECRNVNIDSQRRRLIQG